MALTTTNIGVFDLNLMLDTDRIYPDAAYQSKPFSDHLRLQRHIGAGISPQYVGNRATLA